MQPDTPNPTMPADEAEEVRQIEEQFAGLDNDLVQVEAPDGKPEARDETLNAEDEDETSAGGLHYPPGVRTSGGGTGR